MGDAAAQAGAIHPCEPRIGRLLILVSLLLAASAINLDTTIVNVAC
jgi:hypothetical protein